MLTHTAHEIMRDPTTGRLTVICKCGEPFCDVPPKAVQAFTDHVIEERDKLSPLDRIKHKYFGGKVVAWSHDTGLGEHYFAVHEKADTLSLFKFVKDGEEWEVVCPLHEVELSELLEYVIEIGLQK